MRKTFGYFHYQQYKDVVILQEIFNHSSPSVTLRYIGINQYLEKTKSILDGHIEIMKKDVAELFKNDKLANCESNNILLQWVHLL